MRMPARLVHLILNMYHALCNTNEDGGTAAESGEERKKTEVVDDAGVGSIARGTVGTGSKLKCVGLVSYASDDSNDE